MLWPHETLTLPAGALRQGLMPQRYATPATVLLTLAAVPLLALWHGPWALLLAPLLARLLVLDAAAYVLPHVYTLPLILAGLAAGQGLAVWPWVLGLLVAREVALRMPFQVGLSGGDFMLLAAMVAWLPVHQACAAAVLGCLLWMPVAFMFPKRDIPLGVPLILGWLVFSALGGLPFTHDWPIYLS